MSKNHLIAGAIALALASGTAFGAAEVKTKGGFEIKDGDFSFKLGGRLMLDYVLPQEDVTPMGSNLFARRARLELEGKMFGAWEYKAEYDFAENAVAAKDLFVTYTGFEGSEILIGQYKQPFSLEELSSSKGIAFMERSLIDQAWGTAHRVGVGYRRFGDDYSLTASAYGKEMGVTNVNDPVTGDPSDEPISFGGRFVFAPIKSDDRLLHLGLAVALESTDDADVVRLRARPEARPSNGNQRFVDTGNIASESQQKLGLEVAYMSGGFSVQGEYQTVAVDAMTGPDPSFSGYYVEARWFPGGEVRPYKMSSATFSQVKPLSIEGAWELRARLSSIDLDDGPVAGGTQDDLALGVTFYPNANVRWMLEYVTADIGGGAAEESPSFVQGRFQISW